MTRQRILVVGAGIAGATAAALLGQAGNAVTLVERDDAPRTSGSPVDIRGQALQAADALGVLPQLREADTGVRRIAFLDRRGRQRACASTRPANDPDLELSRSALNTILLARAADVAETIWGDSPAAIGQDPGGVDVTFASGRQRHYDLLIGADGQHSTVRRLVWGEETAFAATLGLAIATAPLRPGFHVPDDTVQMHNAPGVSISIHPAGGHPIAAFIFRSSAPRPPRKRPDQVMLLRDRYDGVGWRTGDLLDAAETAADLYFDVVTKICVPAWSSGSVTLLGDAASSVTILGEGSSMAILGATRLALALGEHSNPANAFAAYHHAHRADVERRQRGSRLGAALLAPATAGGITVRNLLIKATRRI